MNYILKAFTNSRKVSQFLGNARTPTVFTKTAVWVSFSKDIFENLALEEWMYEHIDLSTTNYLLLWNNAPAVVIGRHQNPWLECNAIDTTINRNVNIARRNSGGGTVYHDYGNLNLSFITHRARYDRAKNLEQVINIISSRWNLNLCMNRHHDIIMNGVYKISGTASKLSRNRSFHHFTLLFDVDRNILAKCLSSSFLADSKATRSIPSHVKNMKEEAPDMTFHNLVHVVSQHYLPLEEKIVFIDPTDESKFPGITAIITRLKSWDWIFGKTPPFTISRSFVKGFASVNNAFSLATESNGIISKYPIYMLQINIEIMHGVIQGIDVKCLGKSSESSNPVLIPYNFLDINDIFVGIKVELDIHKKLLIDLCVSISGYNITKYEKCLFCWAIMCFFKCLPFESQVYCKHTLSKNFYELCKPFFFNI